MPEIGETDISTEKKTKNKVSLKLWELSESPLKSKFHYVEQVEFDTEKKFWNP